MSTARGNGTYFANIGLSEQMFAENSPNRLATASKKLEDARKEVENLRGQLDAVNRELEIAQRKHAEIVIRDIERLEPSSIVGTGLAEMARKRIGPFSQVVKVLDVRVTVVGYIRQSGSFNGCEDLQLAGEDVRFTRLASDQQEEATRTVSGRQGGVIQATVCNRVSRKFDIQIGCEDGAVLFPEQVVGCDSDGAVRWQVPGERIFPVSAEILRT